MIPYLVAVIVIASTVAADAQGRHRGHWRGGHHGFDAGGFIGGVIGGAIGGALSRPQYYPPQGYHSTSIYSDAVTYCIRRFRSYNPETGIYMGYDGVPRRCP